MTGPSKAQEGETRNPWSAAPEASARSPSARRRRTCGSITCTSTSRFGESDLDVVLPMRRLTELSLENFVGRPAPTHYSTMG